MNQPLVTVIVPNYKTRELTTLCLRLLRKYTPADKVQVIVVDNDSRDDSLAYLKTLKWITLMERPAVPGEAPAEAHARALDLALATVTTPYVLSIHTDTLVKHPKWLAFLLNEIERDPSIAGVGSWKLEAKPWWRRVMKQIERQCQLAYYKVANKKKHALEGVDGNYYYLRSHCALYRMDALKKLNLHFDDEEKVAGKGMHKQLVEAGYQMVFLPSEILVPYVEHINHATTLLNPSLSAHQHKVNKGLKRMEKSLAAMQAKVILADAGLDN